MTDVSRDSFEVPNGKIVDYLLCLDHPRGGPKAQFFQAFGFAAAHPFRMAEALIAHATDARNDLRVTARLERHRLIVDGPMIAPDGREPRIRTVWQRHEGPIWRLITAHPLG